MGNDFFAFLDGPEFSVYLRGSRKSDSFALSDIKHGVITQKRNLFGLTVIFLLEYFPEDNRKRFLTLFYAAVQRLDLAKGQPERG